MTEMDEAALAECRKAYEEWCEKESVDYHSKHADGNYKLLTVHCMWVAWKAAWSARSPQQAAGEVVEALAIINAKLTAAKKSPVILSWDDAETVKAALTALAPAKPMGEQQAVKLLLDSYADALKYVKVGGSIKMGHAFAMTLAFRALTQHATISEKGEG
jgi:hypothetical protein